MDIFKKHDPNEGFSFDRNRGKHEVMSKRDFADWLADDILYTRNCESGIGYAVYAGDGTFLDIVEDLDEVWASCERHDMTLTPLH